MPLPTLYRATSVIPELGAETGDYVAVHARRLIVMREAPRDALTPAVLAKLEAAPPRRHLARPA